MILLFLPGLEGCNGGSKKLTEKRKQPTVGTQVKIGCLACQRVWVNVVCMFVDILFVQKHKDYLGRISCSMEILLTVVVFLVDTIAQLANEWPINATLQSIVSCTPLKTNMTMENPNFQ